MVFWRFFNRLLYLAPSPALNFPFAALILPRLVSFFAFAALFLPRLVSLFAFATLFSATPCLSFYLRNPLFRNAVSLFLPSQPSFPQRRVSVPLRSPLFAAWSSIFGPFCLSPSFAIVASFPFRHMVKHFWPFSSYPLLPLS
jgi:hypothetical protein